MKRGKAYYRWQREKRVKKWTKIVEGQYKNTLPEHFNGGAEAIEKCKKHDINLRARTPKLCSCAICTKNRKNDGPTLQEKRQMQRTKVDQLNNLED